MNQEVTNSDFALAMNRPWASAGLSDLHFFFLQYGNNITCL